MNSTEPLARCEILFLQPLFASTTLSALYAVDADSSICAVVRELTSSEVFCAKPSLTLGALPRCAIGFLHLDTLLAIFAKTAASWFAPLVRWKMLLELCVSATSAARFRHVFVDDSLPIDILATQQFHKQLWTLCFVLSEHLSLKSSVDQELVPSLHTS